jgi:hypothetical protein
VSQENVDFGLLSICTEINSTVYNSVKFENFVEFAMTFTTNDFADITAHERAQTSTH